MDTGLSYFALLTAFGGASSSFFNPAVPLGSYLAGLAGFGSAALPTSAVVGPLVGAVAIGLLESQLPSIAKEGVGVFVLYLVVGAAGAAAPSAASRSAPLSRLTPIYNVDLNPAVTLAKKIDKYETVLVQLGVLWGGLAGAYLGGFEGTSYDNFDAKAAVGEVLVAVLLVAIIDKSAFPATLAWPTSPFSSASVTRWARLPTLRSLSVNFGNGLLDQDSLWERLFVALFVTWPRRSLWARLQGALKLLNKTIGDLL